MRLSESVVLVAYLVIAGYGVAWIVWISRAVRDSVAGRRKRR